MEVRQNKVAEMVKCGGENRNSLCLNQHLLEHSLAENDSTPLNQLSRILSCRLAIPRQRSVENGRRRSSVRTCYHVTGRVFRLLTKMT
jgi:hypothetical protein